MGHAYSITDVKMVDIKLGGQKGKIPLVRVRNPWGNETEWKGPWCDKYGISAFCVVSFSFMKKSYMNLKLFFKISIINKDIPF